MTKPIVELDARGLEPPQPMICILEALAQLPAGAELHARTDRNPVHLHAALGERGFTGSTQPSSDHGFLTIVKRVGN